MITLSMDGSSTPQQGENKSHCYHLVTLKSACLLQLFAAGARRDIHRPGIFRLWMRI
jgi:hypothetical protein